MRFFASVLTRVAGEVVIACDGRGEAPGDSRRRVSGHRRAQPGHDQLERFAGLRGTDKLDAALRFIVSYQQSYSGVRVIDIEPEVTIAQLTEVIPVMRARLQRLLSGPNAAVKAATAIRVAVSHYIVRSDDADQFLAQLRHAVGIKHNG